MVVDRRWGVEHSSHIGALLLLLLLSLLSPKQTLGTSGGIQPLVCEILVCLVHAPPGVSFEIPIWNMGFEVVYTFESLCSVWQLLRLYLAVGVLNDKVPSRAAAVDARHCGSCECV